MDYGSAGAAPTQAPRPEFSSGAPFMAQHLDVLRDLRGNLAVTAEQAKTVADRATGPLPPAPGNENQVVRPNLACVSDELQALTSVIIQHTMSIQASLSRIERFV